MKKTWLLPVANLLCFIHCVGFGLVSIFAPVLLSGLHFEFLEWAIIAFNLLLGTWIFNQLKIKKVFTATLWTLMAGASLSLFLHWHHVYHGIIIGTAIFQFGVLLMAHNKKHQHKCCNHTHH